MMNTTAATATDSEQASPPVLSISGGRADIRLNRPRVLNRLQPEDVAALSRMLEQIDRDPQVRVLVLTGTGRVFSAGYDLGDLARRRAAQDAARGAAQATSERDAAAAPERGADFAAMTVALENLRVPTICRLNGSVYGGATDLALSCDFRIGIRGCEMFMPAARLGLHYYTDGLVRWTHRLGLGAAKKLFLTARTIKDEEMLRIGYLDELVDATALDETVDALADTLMGQAPRAVEGMKRALNEIARGELDRAAADARHAASLASDDIREGVTAWHEKRKPQFSGR